MKRFSDLPIQRKMLDMTLGICGAVLLVAIAALFTFQVLNFRSNFQRDTMTLAAVIANNSTAALAFHDAKAGSEVVNSLQAEPNVKAAGLRTPDGSLFASFGQVQDADALAEFPRPGEARFNRGQLLYTRTVAVDNKNLGTLYLRMDYRQMLLKLVSFYCLVVLGILVVSVSLAIFLSSRLQRIITNPILQLADTARIVGEKKDYSLRAPVNPQRDELGRLTKSFNEMLGRIESQDSALTYSQQKMEALIGSIDGIVWEWDPRRSIFTFVSPQSQRILGYPPERWLGDPNFWDQLVHPDDLERVTKACAEVTARRAPYDYEYRMIAGNGRTVWIRESGDVLVDQENKAVLIRGIFLDITEQKLAAAELDKLNKQLVETSRHAGMAEVATGVLHNVGNVLNSVNVSTTLIRDRLRGSEVTSLVQLGGLLRQHETDFSAFLIHQAQGRLVPKFIIQLAEELGKENAFLLQEQDKLSRNIEHIKEIVAMQQNYARVSGILERVSIASLVDDALQINMAGFSRHGVHVIRQFAEVPLAMADKHKVLQILVNLVHNAKYALDDAAINDKTLTVGIGLNGNNCLKVTVSDNGIGIPPENLNRIFSHGFSTRKGGHGFGLHSGANAAKEMGGQLSVQSAGVGKGATFTLELPLADPKADLISEPRTAS